MTFSELLRLAEACLIEYEPRLKILGKKPWDASANGSLCREGPGPLSDVTEREMKSVICAILDRLATLNGFVMSGPKSKDIEGVHQTLSHNNLSLTFEDVFDAYSSLNTLRINCWYYPAP